VSSFWGALHTPQPNESLCQIDFLTSDNLSWVDIFGNPPTTTGLGYGMMAGDLSGATTIGFNTYQIIPDTPTRGTFHLFYLPGNTDAIDLRYFVILNEQQIPAFEIDQDVYYDITLQPGEQTSIDLYLPPLSESIHDLIVLGIAQQKLNPSGDVIPLVYRVTLVAGDNPPLAEQEYQLLEPDARKSADQGFFNLSLHSDRSQELWVSPEIYKNVQNTLDFYASVGYMESKERLAERDISPQLSPFAILAFLDSQQIAIASESNAFYGAVTPDTLYSFIPISIKTSYNEGRRDLLVLRVNYPRIPMCWLRGEQEGYQFDNGVYARRVGVEFD